jgi:hypothetical protein
MVEEKEQARKDSYRRAEFRREHNLPENRELTKNLRFGTAEEDIRPVEQKAKKKAKEKLARITGDVQEESSFGAFEVVDAGVRQDAETEEEKKKTGHILSPRGNRVKKWFGIWE